MPGIPSVCIADRSIRTVIQQKLCHPEISAAAGQKQRSQALAPSVGQIHVHRPAFVVQDFLCRIIEIMPYKQMKQAHPPASRRIGKSGLIAALQTELRRRNLLRSKNTVAEHSIFI